MPKQGEQNDQGQWNPQEKEKNAAAHGFLRLLSIRLIGDLAASPSPFSRRLIFATGH
jgi:hypothetical protein